VVLENIETLPACAANIEMDNELIDDLLQRRQVPTATSNAFEFSIVRPFRRML
jgi:hypothetical protein